MKKDDRPSEDMLIIKSNLTVSSTSSWILNSSSSIHIYTSMQDLIGSRRLRKGDMTLRISNRAKIDALISWYFEEFQFNIKKVVVVIDSKLGPTDTDIDMYKYLQEIKVPLVFVLNKIDRLSKNEVFKSLSHTQEIFFGQKVIPLSAKN